MDIHDFVELLLADEPRYLEGRRFGRTAREIARDVGLDECTLRVWVLDWQRRGFWYADASGDVLDGGLTEVGRIELRSWL